MPFVCGRMHSSVAYELVDVGKWDEIVVGLPKGLYADLGWCRSLLLSAAPVFGVAMMCAYISLFGKKCTSWIPSRDTIQQHVVTIFSPSGTPCMHLLRESGIRLSAYWISRGR